MAQTRSNSSTKEPTREQKVRWKPTRKWWAARVVAAAGILILTVRTQAFDQEELIATITLVSEAIVAWLVPNERTATGDGVPT